VRPSMLPAIAAVFCLGLSAAHAQPPCAAQPVFDIEALKSEMMVLATDCHADAQYNAFMERFHPDLLANEHELDAYFRRLYGHRGQTEHDSFITNLANAQSEVGLHQGTDFCPRNEVLFQEAMTVNSNELPAFAAGKDVLPPTLAACQQPKPAATRAAVHHIVHKKITKVTH
jgi:hypothetical protein